MTRSKRLRPIVELATHAEREASVAMADAETRLSEHARLLSELERYHAEYADRGMTGSADAVRLQDYRLFMERLEQAIARQRELIARLETEARDHRDTWTARRSHRKALDNAAARYAAGETRAADKQEQAHIEEVCSLLRTR